MIVSVSRKQRWLRLAKNVALESSVDYKVGCVLVDANYQYVAVGHNEYDNTIRNEYPWSIHAEVNAVAHWRANTKPFYAYVYRAWRNGKIADSRPCWHCQKVLDKTGVRVVYYTRLDGPHVGVLEF